jgi:MFS family permease
MSFASFSRYQLNLLVLLSGLMVFDGLDSNAINVALPLVGTEFGVGPGALGASLSFVSFGSVAAFFVLRLGDRFGRRPMLLVSVGLFGALTLLTAATRSLPEFVAAQFGAKLFMLTQIGLSYILLNEALTGQGRARASGLMASLATLGAALPALLLAPLQAAGVGWRGLYLLGAAPLVFLPLAWFFVRESDLYLQRRDQVAPSLVAELRLLLAPQWRRRFVALSALWIALNMWNSAQLYFFSLYVFTLRGWTAADLAAVAPVSLVVSFAGYFLAGWLGDRYGRRRVVGTGLVIGVILTLLCYQAQDRLLLMGCWVGLNALNGIQPLLWVLTAELFPTEVRAAAAALSNNLIGRWGVVLGPAAVGAISTATGNLPLAIMAVTCVGLLGLPILLALPETRNVDLAAVEGDG